MAIWEMAKKLSSIRLTEQAVQILHFVLIATHAISNDVRHCSAVNSCWLIELRSVSVNKDAAMKPKES